ncbi:TonB-dependent receptor [bacterium]|nr:TonB-dependent receptor [candidate division CSSED10-310 bacterium]
MNNSRSITLLLMMIMVATAGTMHAEDIGDILNFDLGRIEVVGKAKPKDGAAKTEVTREEFDKRLAESVVEAAREAPGVVVTTGSKNEPQVLIRGLAQNRILILLDGIPMAAPYYGDLDSSELPLDGLTSLNIVRGNASVLYGPNSFGGVISLISAKPGNNPNFSLLTTIDQEGNYVGRLTHGMRMGDSFYYQLSAGIRESDGWSMSGDFKTTYDEDDNELEDGDIRKNTQFSQVSAGLKAGFEWLSGEMSVSANYIDSEKGIPPATTDQVRVSYWEFPEWKKYTTAIAGRQQLGEAMEIRANLFYHKYDNALRNYNDPDYEELRWESTYDDYSTGLLTRFSWMASEAFTLRSSLTGVIDNHRSQGNTGDPWEEYEARTYGLMAEGQWQASEQLTVTAGAGWEIYDFRKLNNVEAAPAAVDDRTRDIDALTYSLAARYDLTREHSVTAAVSHKNKFPNMNQLFTNIEEFAAEDIDRLDPERALQYSLGYEYRPSVPYSMGVAAYYYDVNDLIERPSRDDLYANIEQAEFMGLELWSAYFPATGMRGTLAYTYQTAENKLPHAASQDLPHVPDHVLHTSVGYGFKFGTAIDLGYMYRGEAVEYPDIAVEIPSYSLLDLTINHTFPFGLTLSLQAGNLLDENYYEELGFEQPGRTIKLGVKYSMK